MPHVRGSSAKQQGRRSKNEREEDGEGILLDGLLCIRTRVSICSEERSAQSSGDDKGGRGEVFDLRNLPIGLHEA